MAPEETILLVAYIRASCPQQAMNEYTPDAWHDVLSCEPWLTLEAARSAVVELKRRQPFADVSEIIAQAKVMRSKQRELDDAAKTYRPGRRALELVGAEREKLPDPVQVSHLLARFRKAAP